MNQRDKLWYVFSLSGKFTSVLMIREMDNDAKKEDQVLEAGGL
jgi:hypothetical protein